MTPHALADAIEARLAAAYPLTELAIAPELARAVGRYRDAPATIETRAFTGGPLRLLRVARVHGEGLAIANVLALGARERGLPVLGVDVVALGARTLIVADASPMSDRDLSPIAAATARRPPLESAGELPGWTRPYFSPYALFARGDLSIAAGAVLDLVDAWRTIASAEDDATVIDGHEERYLTAHREEDRALDMIGKLFGVEFAARYLSEVLFPVTR